MPDTRDIWIVKLQEIISSRKLQLQITHCKSPLLSPRPVNEKDITYIKTILSSCDGVFQQSPSFALLTAIV